MTVLPLSFRPNPIRHGEAFHILRGDRIIADVYWDARPIPASEEGHPFGWVLRYRDADGDALVEDPSYDPEPKAIMLDEGGHNVLDRTPEEVLWPALDHALALTGERLGEAHA